MKIIELNYHCHDTASVAAVVQLHHPSSGYLHLLKDKADIILVKHLQYKGSQMIDGVTYQFFAKGNRFWQIPFATHRFIRRQKPDIVMVQGLVFPLQVIALKWLLGKRTVIVAQHRGERPWQGIRGWLQRWADQSITAYTFTAKGNAADWIADKVIAHHRKCYEVTGGTVSIARKDKELARQQTGITGEYNFVWVGRLNHNKDPLTVLQAFTDYLLHQPDAKLYMIYQDGDLLDDIKSLLQTNALLSKAVQLLGKMNRDQLADWYSAADFYIAASHREGNGYALHEAMHCGCIPVVTDIPPFHKITDGGKWGFLYQPGSPEDLLRQLLLLESIDKATFSAGVIAYANQQLTHQAIAAAAYGLCERLVRGNGSITLKA